MKTLKQYIKNKKIKDKQFAKNYDKDYADFVISVLSYKKYVKQK